MDNSIYSQRRKYRKNYLDARKYKNLSVSELHFPEVMTNEFVGISKGKPL